MHHVVREIRHAIKNEVKGQFKANAEAVRAKRDALRKTVESGACEAVIREAASEIGNAIGDQAVLRDFRCRRDESRAYDVQGNGSRCCRRGSI